VEAALLTHPWVVDAAVVGRPGDDGLVRVAATVVTGPDAVEADLANALRRHVARALDPHCAPQSVTVVDALPRLPSGKVDRRRLRES
jgi:acyl-coenzyme A synthetase/AMP-(fatty) acid ligase